MSSVKSGRNIPKSQPIPPPQPSGFFNWYRNWSQPQPESQPPAAPQRPGYFSWLMRSSEPEPVPQQPAPRQQSGYFNWFSNANPQPDAKKDIPAAPASEKTGMFSWLVTSTSAIIEEKSDIPDGESQRLLHSQNKPSSAKSKSSSDLESQNASKSKTLKSVPKFIEKKHYKSGICIIISLIVLLVILVASLTTSFTGKTTQSATAVLSFANVFGLTTDTSASKSLDPNSVTTAALVQSNIAALLNVPMSQIYVTDYTDTFYNVSVQYIPNSPNPAAIMKSAAQVGNWRLLTISVVSIYDFKNSMSYKVCYTCGTTLPPTPTPTSPPSNAPSPATFTPTLAAATVPPTAAPIDPTEAPAVPTEAPAVPTEAPAVPTESPAVATETPTTENTDFIVAP